MNTVLQLLSNGGANSVRWEIALSKRLDNPLYLEQYGYRVYSQTDEDGIIQEIFNRIGCTDKRFIEFGVEDGRESNTHYLLLNGWSGLWLEGNENQVARINRLFKDPIKQGQLQVMTAFITRDNIDDLFTQNHMTGEIDLLSVDIDGNDWHVWNTISVVSPRVVIAEYNAKLPPDCEWVMEYEADYCWNESDRHGASLKSWELLGAQKGYQLVGTCIGGTNAFFVRSDLAENRFPLPATAENLYNPCRYHLFHQKTTHPSKGFLKNSYTREERIEELFSNISAESNGVVPVFVAVEGFYATEYQNGRFSIQWMSAENGTLYLSTSGTKMRCCLTYSFGGVEALKGTIGQVSVNGQVALACELALGGGMLEFTVNSEGKYAKLEIAISKLWCPAHCIDTTDNRELGLGIRSLELLPV